VLMLEMTDREEGRDRASRFLAVKSSKQIDFPADKAEIRDIFACLDARSAVPGAAGWMVHGNLAPVLAEGKRLRIGEV
jgi:hypothetical protein